MMYVYIQSEPSLYTVGFYSPDGKWHPDSDWSTSKKAAAQVHYLNGGEGEITPDNPTAHAAETLTWLTIEEAAAYLRVSDRTIRRALRAGDVKAYRVGGRRDLRFRREDLDAYLLPA